MIRFQSRKPLISMVKASISQIMAEAIGETSSTTSKHSKLKIVTLNPAM